MFMAFGWSEKVGGGGGEGASKGLTYHCQC